MFFSKQSIYNSKLKVVANEVIATEHLHLTNKEMKTAAFANFLATIVETTDRHLEKFILLIPFELQMFIKDLSDDIKDKLILKISLRANKPENYIEAEALIGAGYKIAVDIQDRRSLHSIPSKADFIILDNVFIGLIDEKDKKLIDKNKLIIKNIDDYSSFEALQKEGAGLFSGRFIETPKVLSDHAMSSNKIIVLKLLATLNDPDAELDEISKIISFDNIMSYKLLKVVNSPLFRGVSELTSIQDAIIRFGYTNLKKWGLMLSLTNITDKPSELTRLTLERAIMCSNIAKAISINFSGDETFYTAGLFSTLDAFFDTPMLSILDDISLDPNVRNAILNYQGETGQILKKVINFQRGLISKEDEKLTQIYIKSTEEAKKTFKLLGIED